MSEPRRPPAFQVYAADELASAVYYGLTLAERGLLDAMRRVIWCDDSIPADPAGIALAVRRPEGETRDALTERVRQHFERVEGDPARLTCSELRRQMERLMDQRRAQAESANRTNTAKRDGKRNGDRDGDRDGKRDGKRDGEGAAPEQNRTELNRTPSLGKGVDLGSGAVDSGSSVGAQWTKADRPGTQLTADQAEWAAEYSTADSGVVADKRLPRRKTGNEFIDSKVRPERAAAYRKAAKGE